MADEWDTVTKIGSKVRGTAGTTAKEKVIRGESALNAARRQGADIATEKKFGGTNSVSYNFPSPPPWKHLLRCCLRWGL
jgi:putative transcription factor